MDFNATIDLIIKDLNEASEIIDDLKKYPGIPALQVELAKSKCKSAGEVIALLKNLKNIFPEKEESPSPRISSSRTSDQTGGKTTGAETSRSGSKPSAEKTESKSHPKKEAGVGIVADKFNRPPERYEELAGNVKTEKDLSDQLTSKKIESLSDAIGISDKFLFISEIFDGNKEAYTEAIDRLERADNVEDAIKIIGSYTGDKPENEAISQLLELLKRKFPPNE